MSIGHTMSSRPHKSWGNILKNGKVQDSIGNLNLGRLRIWKGHVHLHDADAMKLPNIPPASIVVTKVKIENRHDGTQLGGDIMGFILSNSMHLIWGDVFLASP